MKYLLLLISLTPFVAFGSCNHHMLKMNKKLACVTVKNDTNHDISVTSLNGPFTLKAHASEESMLIPGHNGSVTILPKHIMPHISQGLVCKFSIDDARKNNIFIAYAERTFSVAPAIFTKNCQYPL